MEVALVKNLLHDIPQYKQFAPRKLNGSSVWHKR